MFACSPWSSLSLGWPLYAGQATSLSSCFILFTMNQPWQTISPWSPHPHLKHLHRAHLLLAHIQRALCTCLFPGSLTVLNINVGIISEAPKELWNAGPAVIGGICVFPSGKTIVKINLVLSREPPLCLKAYDFIQAGETTCTCALIESKLFG